MKTSLTNWTAFYELGALCIQGLEKNHSGYSKVKFTRVPEEDESGLLVYSEEFGHLGEEIYERGDLHSIHFHDFRAPAGIKKVRLYFDSSRLEFIVENKK